MKQTIIGSLILVSMVAALALFPISAGILDSRAHTLDLQKDNIAPAFLTKEKAPAVLLYFGYVGCTTICIPALDELASLYTQIRRTAPDTAFYFVNLNPTQPREWVEPFAKSFHNNFHGIYATASQIDRMEQDFNLAVTGNEEMSHSSNLYLMVRQNGTYVLRRIYTTHPYPKDLILQDIGRFT